MFANGTGDYCPKEGFARLRMMLRKRLTGSMPALKCRYPNGEGQDNMVVQVGSGTDPAEGAALAGAILDRLAGSARLTFATSHHAELKNMPVCLSCRMLNGLPFDDHNHA